MEKSLTNGGETSTNGVKNEPWRIKTPDQIARMDRRQLIDRILTLQKTAMTGNESPLKESCRHPKAWPINNGCFLWCPDCGAVRRTRYNPDTKRWELLWNKWLLPRGAEKSMRILTSIRVGVENGDTLQNERMDKKPKLAMTSNSEGGK